MEPENNKYIHGQVLLIDKPIEWSSFQLVKKVRNSICRAEGIKKLKVGHAGTLDPLATGLMILGTGRFTKKLNEFKELDKEYMARIELGKTTPSFDMETDYDGEYPVDHIDLKLCSEVCRTFVGKQQQVPPLFSAKNIGGKRAYEFARAGKDHKMEPVMIEIMKIEVLNLEENHLNIRVLCSRGTYIRALARDLGKALSSGACLAGLRRTRIGEYSIDDAVELSTFEKMLQKT